MLMWSNSAPMRVDVPMCADAVISHTAFGNACLIISRLQQKISAPIFNT